ncbi:hypothetical protein BAC3_00563 [uncultured bacterium]|nr:hypothetical protein BAC3_00563 [uncultured bacterium]
MTPKQETVTNEEDSITKEIDLKLEIVHNPFFRTEEHDLPYLGIETKGRLGCIMFGDFPNFSEKTYSISSEFRDNSLKAVEKTLEVLYNDFQINNTSFMINQTCHDSKVNYSWFGYGPANFIQAIKEQSERYSETGFVRTHHSEVAGFMAIGNGFIFYMSVQPYVRERSIEPTNIDPSLFYYGYAGFIFTKMPFNNGKFIDFYKKVSLKEPDFYKKEDLHFMETDLPNISSTLNKELVLVDKKFPGNNDLSDAEEVLDSTVILDNPFFGDIKIDTSLSAHKKIVVNLLPCNQLEKTKNIYLKKLRKISLPSHGFPLEVINIYGSYIK